jgi:uncharacterized protein DUF4397
MIGRRISATVLIAALAGLLAPAALAASAHAAATGEVYVVQGLIGQSPDIFVDGSRVLAGAKGKSVVGPLALDAGSHQVVLKAQGKTIAQERFRVAGGSSVDVVAHLRSDSRATPMLTAFRNDLAAVAPGKLRLTVAHVAAAPPADIKVNGDTLFSNVASGEALTVTVPAKTYTVEVVPAATAGDPILGPLPVRLRKGTLTRVFAVGNVATGNMDAVVHTLRVGTAGSSAPRSVPTGDGGQAAAEFAGTHSATADVLLAGGLGLLASAALLTLAVRRGRRPAAVPARR